MTRSIITGASGFVGRALVEVIPGATPLPFAAMDWRERLAQAELQGATVFHLAARVHRAGDHDEAGYARDNVEKTVALARAAAAANARVFVFASSIKVNGEETRDKPFTASDAPAPEDAYGRSKLAAERALADIARETGLAVHIVRPPLVYGPRVAGNLRALLRLCQTGIPLPFGALRNRRSFLAVDDLARLLAACAQQPEPGVARTWLAAHPQPISTTELVATLRDALGRPRRLVPVPAALLEALGALAGKRAEVRRLVRSLEVDASATIAALGWQARVSLEEVASRIAAAHRGSAP